MAFKARNLKFLPFFAKNHDVTPYQNCKIQQKIYMLKSAGKWQNLLVGIISCINR